jgi:hypothetical protein
MLMDETMPGWMKKYLKTLIMMDDIIHGKLCSSWNDNNSAEKLRS